MGRLLVQSDVVGLAEEFRVVIVAMDIGFMTLGSCQISCMPARGRVNDRVSVLESANRGLFVGLDGRFSAALLNSRVKTLLLECLLSIHTFGFQQLVRLAIVAMLLQSFGLTIDRRAGCHL